MPTYVFNINGQQYASPNPWMQTVTMAQPTWNIWVNSAATTISQSQYTIQTHWYNSSTVTSYSTNVWNDWQRQPMVYQQTYQQPSAEELERRRVLQLEREQAQALLMAEKKAAAAEAKKRATETLHELLDDEQKEMLEKEARFIVCSRTGKKYELRSGFIAGNVSELDAHNKPVARYCCHVYDDVPQEDNLIAQMLMLTTDEEGFLAKANRSVVRV